MRKAYETLRQISLQSITLIRMSKPTRCLRLPTGQLCRKESEHEMKEVNKFNAKFSLCQDGKIA